MASHHHLQPCCSRDRIMVKAFALRTHAGFSLVELLVVVTIVAVLATIGLPLAELAHRRTNEEELRQSLREIRSALDAYKKAADQGHITKQVDASGYPPNLDALVAGVTDAQSPRGQKLFFLRRLPRDPFAHDDILSSADTWGVRSYASTSEDPKSGADVFDVFSKSTDKGMNGVPYRKW
ncbi:MAG: type II secretion system protein [Aquabacterium sp.]|nr:type II secretion system protein [Aquabacterium sp.]